MNRPHIATIATAAALAFSTLPASAAESFPEWINEGSGSFIEDGRRVLRGVGIAQGIQAPSLAATTADLRACDEVGKLINSFISELSKDYLAPKGATESEREAHASETMKNFVKLELSGPEIKNRWLDSADGAWVSLCELDVSHVKEALKAGKEITPDLRKYILEKADKAFAEIAGSNSGRKAAAVPAEWREHAHGITAVSVSPDGTKALSADLGRIALWNLSSGRPAWSAPGAADLVLFSPDGNRAAAVALSGLAGVWDAATGKPLPGGRNRIKMTTLSKSYFATVTAGETKQTTEQNASQTAKNLVTSSLKSDGINLTASALGMDYLASAADGNQSTEDQQISLSSTFTYLNSSGAATIFRRLAAKANATNKEPPVEAFEVVQEFVSRDGRKAATLETSGTLSFHAPGARDAGRAQSVAGLLTADLSPDGTVILAGGQGAADNLTLWDRETGSRLASWTLPAPVTAVAFFPDGRKALIGLGSGPDKLRVLRFPAGAGGKPRYDSSAGISSLTIPKPDAPARLSAAVSFSEPSGDNILHAGQRGALTVTVSNAGPGAAHGLRLTPRLEAGVAGLELPTAQEVETLAAGKTAVREFPLAASEDLGTGRVRLKIEVEEANGFDADPVAIEFKALAFQAPRLELASLTLGGSGFVKAGEVAQLIATIRNAGPGPAKAVSASLILGSADLFASGDTLVSLGSLAPGESKKAQLDFFVNKRYKGGKTLPVSLTLTESLGRYGVEAQPLKLVLGESAPSTKLVTVEGREAPDLDLDAPPKTKSAPDPNAFAVVIGIEKYRQASIPAVDFAARDAQTVHAYLTQAMGFDDKNVILLQDEQATKTDLEKYLGTWLRNRVGKESRVLIYFAGHGAPNPKTGEGYLIPYEGDPAYTEDSAFPVRRLYETLAKLPARSVLVALDACFSGQGKRSVLAKGARPLVSVKLAVPAGENTVVIAATGADQISTYNPDARHGLMTYSLLKGLRGDADSDRDGQVTTSELFTYLKPAVERQARLQNVEQVPTISPSLESLGARGREVWIKK